jgi:hypothetical protein
MNKREHNKNKSMERVNIHIKGALIERKKMEEALS